MGELIVEVDVKDNVLGLRERSEFVGSKKYIHRASHLLLRNSKGEILLQKRAKTKKWYPGLYSYSASGTVADEGYEECMQREVREELGLNVDLKPLFKFFLDDVVVRAWNMVFGASIEGDFKIEFPEDEVEEVVWISQMDLKRSLKDEPGKYTPGFVKGIKEYFS